MRTAVHRPLLAVLVLALVGLAGCGKGGPSTQSAGSGGVGTPSKLAPVAVQGAVSVATRNTTRLGGEDVADDAAAVARAVYPGLTAATRPTAIVLVDEHDWTAALAASVLASAPTNAPILYSEGETLPTVSAQTLEAMHPLGAPLLGGAHVIRIGTAAALPAGYLARQVPVGAAAPTAATIARLALALDGSHPPRQVIVLAEGASRPLAMPAAGLAAESGAPILFVGHGRVPAATAAALASLHRPSIYVIDAGAISHRALDELRRLGPVKSIPTGASTGTGASSPGAAPGAGATSSPPSAGAPAAGAPAQGEAAVQNAIEVARFTDGTFGWGVKEPGHGLVFANVGRPLDAPASALLSATGNYGPLLLLSSAGKVPSALVGYLSDIQPAYAGPQFPAVRGAYNHGWLIGDEGAITAVVQAEIDSMLEIVSRPAASEEAASQGE
jgi:hypothetical protein